MFHDSMLKKLTWSHQTHRKYSQHIIKYEATFVTDTLRGHAVVLTHIFEIE